MGTIMDKSLLHTPEGVRDIYGEEYAAKLLLENRLHETLCLFGYQDIQTPTFEYFDVFSKETGTTPSGQLYKFFDREGDTLVLRPDFTPSCARCCAKYFVEEDRPVRFTYSGNTFVNISNLQGKLREATQMGAELMMDASVEADAEMICLIVEALKNSGLTDFQITVGQVEYFKGVCSQAGLEEGVIQNLRDAISTKNYFGAKQLLEENGVRHDYAQVLLGLADTVTDSHTLDKAKTLASNERSLLAVERLEKLYHLLCAWGIEKYVSFDLGLLSKYNYYTGVIFKGYTYGVGDAIVTGGRYDSLLARFGKQAPAIGFVIVVDDLMEALTRQRRRPQPAAAGVLLLYEGGAYQSALQKAQELRARKIPTELSPMIPGRGDYPSFARQHLQNSVLLAKENGEFETLL